MDKSISRFQFSTAERSPPNSARTLFTTMDKDIESQRQYLQKLKAQRIKTQKIYRQFQRVKIQRDHFEAIIRQLRIQRENTNTRSMSTMNQYQIQISKLQSQITKLQAQAKNIRTQCQTSRSFNQKIHELQRDIFVYEQNQKSDKDLIQRLEQQIEELQKENEDLRSNNDSYNYKMYLKMENQDIKWQNLNKYSKEEKQIMENQINLLRSQRDRLIINIAKIEEEKNLSTKDHLELMKKYDYLVKDHEQNKVYWANRFAQKNNAMLSERKKMQKLKEDYKKLKKQIEISSKQNKQMFFCESYQRQSTNSQTLFKLKKTQQELASFKYQYQQHQKACSNSTLRIQALQRQLKGEVERNKRLTEDCQQYMRIIQRKQYLDLQRKDLIQFQHDQITRIQKIMKKFQ